VLIPSLVLAPEYFAGKIEFGTMTQVGTAGGQPGAHYVLHCARNNT